MKLYYVVVRFIRLANHLYFVEARASGAEKVPSEGPVMLAANHPSSILDTFLLATRLPRIIHYLARSGLFRHPLLAGLLLRLGAIPLYRAGEETDHAGRNVEVFEKVYELFERGGCVGIFPEGRNSPYGRLGEIRKGAARMAFGAEERNDWKLGLKIVPVGLNFENRELFMSAVMLCFADPIRVADYEPLYRQDPERAVEKLTADIRETLSRQVAHVEDVQLGELASELAEVFGEDLGDRLRLDSGEEEKRPQPAYKRWLWALVAWYRRSSPAETRAFVARVYSRQHISRTLSRASEVEPQTVESLRNQLERYKDHLRQTEFRHDLAHSLSKRATRERLIRSRMTLYAVLMAPVALFGLIHNAVPYLFAKFTARLSRDQAVRTFAYFGLGVVAFTVTYATFGFWLWRYTDLSLGWSLAYLAALPPTGFAALHYRRNILLYRDMILVRTLFWNNHELVTLVRHERRILLERFQQLADRYGNG